eukprot:2204111-Pyramimonas_sp.AAC.1
MGCDVGLPNPKVKPQCGTSFSDRKVESLQCGYNDAKCTMRSHQRARANARASAFCIVHNRRANAPVCLHEGQETS